MPTISVSKKEIETILWYREKALNDIKTPECKKMLERHDQVLEGFRLKFIERKRYEDEWKAKNILKSMESERSANN